MAGTLTVTKAKNSKTKAKTKKLEYNFKEVSARILNAKTSGNARSAVIMARNKVSMLRRMLKTGEYDSEELEGAILHAQQIERVAKKRQKHLQQEERAERANGTDPMLEKWEEKWEEEQNQDLDLEEGLEESFEPDSRELQQLMQEMQELLAETMESLDSEELFEKTGGIEELSEELMDWEDIEPEDLELRKKKHRAEELRDIVEADMKYLKALFDRLEKGQSSSQPSAASGNVSLQLGGMEMPVAVTEVPVMAEGGTIDVSV